MKVSNGGVIQTAVLRNAVATDDATICLDHGHLEVGALVLNRGGTLLGNGTIAGDAINDGIIAPGLPTGSLSVVGDYLQLAEGMLKIDLSAYTAGIGFDLLAIGGVASLGGTLHVDLLNGFSPAPDATFGFLTAATVTGVFDSVLFEDGTVDISYLATGVRLSNFQTLAPPAFPGDANGDRVVGFADLGILLNNYNQPGPFSSGDFDASGTVDFADLGMLLNNYHWHAPTLAPACLVPEPGTLVLAALGAVGLLMDARRVTRRVVPQTWPIVAIIRPLLATSWSPALLV